MNKITLTLPNKKSQGVAHDLSGPACWAEVSHVQYMALCRIGLLIGKHPELRLTLPAVLYGLTPKQGTYLFDPEATRKAGYPADMRADLLSYGQALLATTDWVFTSLPTTWPYRLREHGTVGPGDGLKDLSFGEFMACEAAFTRILAGDQTQLPKLIAQLLSPAGPNPALRTVGEPDVRIFYRAERYANKSTVEQYAYLLAYQGAREALASHFRHVFPKADPNEEAEEETAKSAKPPVSWYTLALDMAEGKVDTFEANARANVYLVLSLLDRQLAQQAETA